MQFKISFFTSLTRAKVEIKNAATTTPAVQLNTNCFCGALIFAVSASPPHLASSAAWQRRQLQRHVQTDWPLYGLPSFCRCDCFGHGCFGNKSMPRRY
jgi:hypothetical protein